MNTLYLTQKDFLNDPFFIGFDTLFDKISGFSSNQTTNYPPYSLVKQGEDVYLIELAVAGFKKEEIDVEHRDGTLTISSKVGDEAPEQERKYLHRGIAKRSFTKKYTLADTIVVEYASMEDGVLTVRLRNVVPEEKKPKKITVV